MTVALVYADGTTAGIVDNTGNHTAGVLIVDDRDITTVGFIHDLVGHIAFVLRQQIFCFACLELQRIAGFVETPLDEGRIPVVVVTVECFHASTVIPRVVFDVVTARRIIRLSHFSFTDLEEFIQCHDVGIKVEGGTGTRRTGTTGRGVSKEAQRDRIQEVGTDLRELRKEFRQRTRIRLVFLAVERTVFHSSGTTRGRIGFRMSLDIAQGIERNRVTICIHPFELIVQVRTCRCTGVTHITDLVTHIYRGAFRDTTGQRVVSHVVIPNDIWSILTRIRNIQDQIVTHGRTIGIGVVRDRTLEAANLAFVGSCDFRLTRSVHRGNIDTVVVRTVWRLESRGHRVLFRQRVTTLPTRQC